MQTAFFITPFGSSGAGGESEELFQAVQSAIREAAEIAGVQLIRADDIFASGVVIDQIRSAIEAADVVVAVCTGKNANVFYELGLAEVLGHKPVLVASSSDDLPFDIHHWRAQLYEGGSRIGDLGERVARAIREELEERRMVEERTERLSREAKSLTQPSVQRSGSDVVRDGNEVEFADTAKRLILEAFESFEVVAEANWHQSPSKESLEALRDERFPVVENIIGFLAPAIEYKPALLQRPLRLLAECFEARVNPSQGGYVLWQKIHESWTYLVLMSCAALAAHAGNWESLKSLLSIPGPAAAGGGDDSPLLINPQFTWPDGMAGNSEYSFDQVVAFADRSDVMKTACKPRRVPRDGVCGASLLLCLARAVWEEVELKESPIYVGHRPYTYPGFYKYDCPRISWIARQLEVDGLLASALGARDLAGMKRLTRETYPQLLALGRDISKRSTCPGTKPSARRNHIQRLARYVFGARVPQGSREEGR
ncbi:MAG: hypothetical protein ACRDIX_02555 [Actinomycetota bacterium]